MARALTDDLLFAPIRELAELLRTRQITSSALTEACLARLGQFGPKLGAVVTVTGQRARREAAAADREIKAGHYRGPLHGVPYGAKDLLATEHIPTTWGADPYREQVFDYDATVVRKLRAAGAVLVSKLAMVELAGGFGYNNADASFTGPGRTPWNLDFWSGGSSSGSGAAVAAGLVPFAIGSETSGSILTPASFCGVTGLRPTYGRVSRHGAMALCWSLDKLGPLARSAEDCGLVLAALAGSDPLDPTAANRSFHWPPARPRKKFKVGILKGATEKVQPAVKRNFDKAVEVLTPVAEIVPDVALPDLPFSEVVGTIVNAEAASAFRDLLESGQAKLLRAANDRWGGFADSTVLAIDYLQAQRLRGPMKKAMDERGSGFDALLAPGTPTVAYAVGRDFSESYPGVRGVVPVVPAGNAVGQPALCVPNGFGDNGLPTSMQLLGRIWGEDRLLALAAAYQHLTDWHRRRPPFPALSK
jgi:aspartyl-tRNA(Asn)/glutamyl-tRNA(Gln) amidotransferase subunit A